ncbi:hypothetical protein P7C70_g8494, partial [Phenoliferia sp. Uapishka_3]
MAPLLRTPRTKGKAYRPYNSQNILHTLQPRPCSYCLDANKPNCYTLRSKTVCEGCSRCHQPCTFQSGRVAPAYNTEKEETAESSGDDSDGVVVVCSPARSKLLLFPSSPLDAASNSPLFVDLRASTFQGSSGSKRPRVEDSDNDGGDGSSLKAIFYPPRGGKGASRERSSTAAASIAGSSSNNLQVFAARVDNNLDKEKLLADLKVEVESTKGSSSPLQLISKILELKDQYAQELDEKDATFEVERRGYLAQIDDSEQARLFQVQANDNHLEETTLRAVSKSIADEEEKHRVAVGEAEARLNAEWEAKINDEVRKRGTYSTDVPVFSTCTVLGCIREELVEVDNKGINSHNEETASLITAFAKALRLSSSQVSKKARPFVKDKAASVYEGSTSI